MVIVGLQCKCCLKQLSSVVAFKVAPRHWARNMWKNAVQDGWVRDLIGDEVYCASCRDCAAKPSSNILPVDSLPFVASLVCDRCRTQFAGEKPNLNKGFSQQLRKAARYKGWVYTSYLGNESYEDLCSTCAVTATENRHEALVRLVWTRPTLQAAQELGVSDKAIEKQCKLWNVVKPPRGFWAKWHAGHMFECLQMIPAEVKEVLGDEMIQEVFPLTQE